MSLAGLYCRIIATSHRRPGECTNLGVVLFGVDGKQLAYRVDTPDRAVRRGDLTEGVLPAQYLDNFARGLVYAQGVRHAEASMGHAMSCVQVTRLLPILLDYADIDAMFARDVLGLEVPNKPKEHKP